MSKNELLEAENERLRQEVIDLKGKADLLAFVSRKRFWIPFGLVVAAAFVSEGVFVGQCGGIDKRYGLNSTESIFLTIAISTLAVSIFWRGVSWWRRRSKEGGSL